MDYISKITGICLLVLLLGSCDSLPIKRSETLSRAVYLADDSFEKGRLDITDTALDQAVRLVPPPKNRIAVEEVPISSNSTKGNSTISLTKQQRIVIVPEKFGTSSVAIVGSIEYQNLLNDKKNLAQLQKDWKSINDLKQETDKQIIKENQEALLTKKNLEKLRVEVAEKGEALWKRNAIIGALIIVIAGGIYLRIKGIL